MWEYDPAHSYLGFTVRHAGISRVRGAFSEVSASLDLRAGLENAALRVDFLPASIDTGDRARDGHLRSREIFNVEEYPRAGFVMTRVDRGGEDEFDVRGDLTIKGTTRPVVLEVVYNGSVRDSSGVLRAGFSGQTHLSRREFGLVWSSPMDSGGLLVGDKVGIVVDAEFMLVPETVS